MSYCNAMDFDHSQIVFVTGPNRDDIMKACGWTNSSSLTKGLNALCKCNAIRRVSRGVYQINPEFAGRGSWRYNSKLDQGGIKNIIAEFNFALNKVRTRFDVEYDDMEDYDTDDSNTDDSNDNVYVAATKSDCDVIASMSGSSTPTE